MGMTVIKKFKCAYGNDYHFEMIAHIIPIRTEGRPLGWRSYCFLETQVNIRLYYYQTIQQGVWNTI